MAAFEELVSYNRVSVSQRRGRWAAVTAAGIALALAAVLCVMLQGRPGALAVDDMKTTAEKFFGTEGKGTYNAVSSDDSSPGQDYGIYNAMNDEEYAKVHKYVQENTDEDGALTDDDRRSDAGFLEPLNEVKIPSSVRDFENEK